MPKEKRRNGDCDFNNGSMIVGKKYLNEKTYNALLEYNLFGKPGHLRDQKLYNYFFKGQIKEIEHKWNVLITELDFIPEDEIKILHYIHKPNLKSGRENIPLKYLDLWWSYA